MKKEATVFACDICGERETVGTNETPRTIEFRIDWAEKCPDKSPWQTKHICADCLKEANACADCLKEATACVPNVQPHRPAKAGERD